MRKAITISLIVLFAFNLAGYYLAFPLVSWGFKGIARAGMEANIIKKNLVLIKIPSALEKTPNADFQKTEDDEFQYQGRMYDVSNSEIKGDTTYYYCYDDKDEDQLLAGLDDHINTDAASSTGNSKKDNHDSVKKPLKVYLKTAWGLIGYAQLTPGTIYSKLHTSYISVIPDNDTPPPKRIG